MSNISRSASYRIWLCDPRGTRLELIDNFNNMTYARAHGNIGRATIQLPMNAINRKLLEPDYIWQIWRTPPGGLSRLRFAGMARKFRYFESNNRDMIDIEVEDGVGLLYSRIVAYAARSSQASKDDVVDDIMKAIVRENLGGSATDTDRDLSAYDFEVQTDVGLGPSTTVAVAHKFVGEALDNLFWDSASQGTPVFYDVQPKLTSTGLGWVFLTATGQLGSDRTYSSGMPAVFSRNFGNLESPDLTFDHTQEVTVVYAGGQGEGSFREIVEVEATGRRQQSPWNRREIFDNSSNLSSTTELTRRAGQLRREGRPRKKFVAKLKDSKQTRFGVDWDYGDKVVVKAYGVSFNAHINAFSMGVDQDGNESLDTRVEILL